jgi:hypothetical protein
MPHVSVPVHELLRLAASPAALLQIATDLRIGQPGPLPNAHVASPEAELAERTWLLRDGFARLAAVVPPLVSGALVRGVRALRARGLPATFIYAFDEPWAIGERVRERLSAVTGHTYAVVEDVWAWEIPPGEGGWPPHRGIRHVRLDREAPEIINVWVALSEVAADRGCMHAIPLDEDPGYPGALDRVDAPLSSVRALPASAGDVLFWNANVLHWGGRCAPRAAGPRVSCSFTLCRADATSRFPELAMLPALAELTLARRMDLLAGMVLLYGHDQPDVSDVVREWARIAHGLSNQFSRGS